MAHENAMSDWDQPILEPKTQAFIDALQKAGGPPLYTLSPAEAHQVLTDLQSQPVDKLPADIEDTTFPVGPTGSTRIRISVPRECGKPFPW